MEKTELLKILTDLDILSESLTHDYQIIENMMGNAADLYTYTESHDFLCKQRGIIAKDVGYAVLEYLLGRELRE